jgi:hypothetical protein
MYTLTNLEIILKNISRYNSKIYTKNKINYMINKKKTLIKEYNKITYKLIYYNKLVYYNNVFNIIKFEIKKLNIKLSIIITLINQIEKEEKLIMKVFKISTNPIINCLRKMNLIA